jgi:hypothetical protein
MDGNSDPTHRPHIATFGIDAEMIARTRHRLARANAANVERKARANASPL